MLQGITGSPPFDRHLLRKTSASDFANSTHHTSLLLMAIQCGLGLGAYDLILVTSKASVNSEYAQGEHQVEAVVSDRKLGHVSTDGAHAIVNTELEPSSVVCWY
jgi:hypothetical protein